MFWLSALGLLKKYWKYLLLIAVVVGLFLYHQRVVHNFGVDQYNKGVHDTLQKAREAIAAKDKDNRRKETVLQKSLDDFANQKQVEDNRRHLKEQEMQERISNLMDNSNGDICKVPNDVLEFRNLIRQLGPE